MAWLLDVCLVIIFLVCLLMSLASGLWGNLIMIFNVIIAGLIATNYFEPLAVWLDGQMPSYTFFCDFVAMWAIFSLSVIILRALTDTLSRVKVRFKKPVELAGGLLCGAIVGWLMVCFSLFSLHTAPLATQFLGGGFNSGANMFLGTAPDRAWGRFAAGQSNPENGPLTAGEGFDLTAYAQRYLLRRAAFEGELGMRTNK
jgi:Colicin V production protein